MKTSFWRGAAALAVIALVPATSAALADAAGSSYKALDTFMDVYQRVRAEYVVPVDDDKLIAGAINGMLASLDPHSSYLDQREFQNLRTQTDGNYGGLGLSVTIEDGAVKVIAPTEDTPAWRAGIKPGDYITHLDGALIYGGSLDESVEKMRGKPGTTVKLTIVRQGRDKSFDVTLTREMIELKPVKWQVKDNVGVININTFSADTGTDVKKAIREIEKSLGHRPLGYVLDLRSNPGGLLDEAIDVSDVFLERGEIVSQRGRNKNDIERYYARPGDDTGGLPLVVLVDAGSASASEIVAGALQDQHRGLIMGERTFGKGSVQTVLPLTATTGLRLTTARYYTPSGRSVQEGGIEPDVVVPQLSDPDYKDRKPSREADLRQHLINEIKIDNSVLEDDGKPDPRFAMTADQAKAKGIEDFQLYYALQTLGRLQPKLAAASPVMVPKPAAKPAPVKPAARKPAH